MIEKSLPAHHMQLYASGVTLSVLLALYYWRVLEITMTVQKLWPAFTTNYLSPAVIALLSLSAPGAVLSALLCLLWPFVRAKAAPHKPADGGTKLADVLQKHRPVPTFTYTITAALLIYFYNLALLAPPWSLLDYGANILKAVSPLVSGIGAPLAIVTGLTIDLYAVRLIKPASQLLAAILVGTPTFFMILFERTFEHNEYIPYELGYLMLAKLPLIVGIAIITDLFRRISQRSGYFSIAVSALIVVLLSQPLSSTQAVAMLACSSIFGFLRASGTSLRLMLALHLLSQMTAYFLFKHEYLFQYVPSQLSQPFIYYS